jgi:DNA (cytosine-5)-methyltransferase 1
LANTKSEGGKRREPGNPGIDSQSTEELPRRSRSRNGTRQEWTTEPDVGRVAYGIPERSHRLRGLGNAIVPQVAEQILRALIESEAQPRADRISPRLNREPSRVNKLRKH